MRDTRGPHPPLSKVEAYRRLHGLKRGMGVATVVGFGVLGGLAFPHGAHASPSQASGTTPATGTAAGAQPAGVPGDTGLTALQDGADAIGGFFNAVGSALFGQDQTGQGQDQTGQGGYGFGPANSGGAPATGSGVS